MTKQIVLGARGVAITVLGFKALACNNAGPSKPTAPAVEHEPAPPMAPMAGHEHAGVLAKITVNESGFSPSAVSLKKGEHAVLEFIRTTDATCATNVSFPELNITRDLPLNTPVQIQVPTDQTRRLAFQCGMGMLKGTAVIN